MTWCSDLPVVMNQSSYTGWNNRSSKCDSNKVFPLDNQHDSDATFPQEGVRLETVGLKNEHLALSHKYPSPVVRSQQVRS
ncbi:unnamed protein product [Schistosoma margrebowiei]|uniref:Uncharacterized protein n=1 Tax=Schistosoma margrebowiei TaxID=48269 RepID=A0A3P8EWM5_9TREM|nr:unnamed protein product [Schistosoma margrebowiei]